MMVIAAGALVLVLALAAPPSDASEAAAPTARRLKVGAEMPLWRYPVGTPDRWPAGTVNLHEWMHDGARRDERVLITFGASWCGPCKLELTELATLRDELEAHRTTVFVVISDEDPEGQAAMLEWVEANTPFAAVVDDLGMIRRRYRVEQLPAAFVPDGCGRVALVSHGYDDSGPQSSARRLIEQLSDVATGCSVPARVSPGDASVRPASAPGPAR
jgi:thiol-disulfide isomerase/thioredoxin